MHTPKEFVTLCRWFHQDCFWGHETGEQAVEAAISNANLSAAELKVVSAYLDELLSGQYKDEQLERIWRKSGAGVSILTEDEGNAAGFLRGLRSMIDDLTRPSAH
ncbi:hypothetical protein [Methylocystis bryophila]|uniref:CdiI immunity protein domain-containing protein n=1 Tax=Methylocystis bryophila TaxID=655015 RepID=A0A1W6MX53_9HYPH|nr:hypothetical protein [Methylocystis bryophila]ARN82168.1 hypothetical protein B1812_14955 [Methylocystis bryophila]BDV38299.1 hypothetical protein DSM21852_15520 [Methylocystis bryophila]